MESPAQGRPNRETGLPPEWRSVRSASASWRSHQPVGPGHRQRADPPASDYDGCASPDLGVIGAVITIGWLVLIWYTLAVRAASPGLRAMKLQLVGFLDGRPIGLGRVFIRALVFWALFITGIGLLIMLIMMLRHPRKQGWHDLAVTSVMIKSGSWHHPCSRLGPPLPQRRVHRRRLAPCRSRNQAAFAGPRRRATHPGRDTGLPAAPCRQLR